MSKYFDPKVNLGHIIMVIGFLISSLMFAASIRTELEIMKHRQAQTEKTLDKISSAIDGLTRTQVELTTIMKKESTHTYEPN